MKLASYYWPEILVNGVGWWCAIRLARRLGGYASAGWWILAAWFSVNSLIGLGAFLGWRPSVSTMILRGYGFALAASVTSVWILDQLRRSQRLAAFSPGRRRLIHTGICAAMAAPFALTGYGAFVGRKQFRLVEVDLAIQDLAPDFEGLRLVQLTDIHLSPFLSRAELRWCVDMANETRADLGLVTGDLVTGATDAIEPCLDELRRLKASMGIYGCLGNHERYLEAESYTAIQGLRRGIHFLRDTSLELKKGDARLNLVGVDFKFTAETHFREFAPLRRPGQTNVLLCHNPALFPKMKGQGWDLVVAGHTHGGQLEFEIGDKRFAPLRLATPYVYGVYREGGSLMYVSRGIGTVGVPARIGAPPEVALLRLRRA